MRIPPTIRLHLLVARAAPRILIIRRGPTRVYHLALWHTDTDVVEHGSWFRGQLSIYRCDLSWDGAWLAYFALGPTRDHWSWTAVARPPWLHAERFHSAGDTWGGGGLWVGPGRLWLSGAGPARADDPEPAELGFVARGAAVERYSLDDIRRGTPSFRYDLADLTPPPPPPPRPRPAAQIEPLASLGPEAQGRYHFLGEPARRRNAEAQGGHLIRGQADLRALAPVLREDRTWSFEKPQTYIVDEAGVFVLGGHINEHVGAAGGRPVLAAGEAVLEEQPDGAWAIAALNNRSYGYMPGPECWPAVERERRCVK